MRMHTCSVDQTVSKKRNYLMSVPLHSKIEKMEDSGIISEKGEDL